MNENYDRPPRLAAWLARLCLHEVDADVVLGDLEETYGALHRRYGPAAARRWYWSQVLRSFPHLLTRTFYWSTVMLKNYVKIALRQFKKHKGYAFINGAGLAAGLTCFLLIALYVQYERSYDAYHQNADRLYRMTYEDPTAFYQGSNHYAMTPVMLAQALRQEIPEVETATVLDPDEMLVRHGDQHFFEDGLWADAHLLDVFTFPLVRGRPEAALSEPDGVLITERLAAKYFGADDPMGKVLEIDEVGAFTVTGVLQDIPENSHFHFDFVAPIQRRPGYEGASQNWGNTSFRTYFMLQPGLEVSRLEAKLAALSKKYHPDREDPAQAIHYVAQPVTKIHLHSALHFEIENNSDIRYLYLLGAIAAIILLLACINYMNLASARAAGRAAEVGLRKVVGAHRMQIVKQFIGESMLLSLGAVVLAMGAVYLLLPVFSALVDRPLAVDLFEDGYLLGGVVLLGLLVGLVAGSYPAFYMAALSPVQVLKGSPGKGVRGGGLRNVLVTLQFTASIVLVIATVVVVQQLHYMQSKKLGYNKAQVVVVPVADAEVRAQYETIKAELMTHPSVVKATVFNQPPTNITSSSGADWEGKSDDGKASMHLTTVDYDFVDFFEIEVIEGRAFSRDFAADAEGAYLVNETAARLIGGASVLGKPLRLWTGEAPIVGVMKDFHYQPLHEPIRPFALYLNPQRLRYVAAKIRPEDFPATLAFIEKTMQAFSPDYPFDYYFLDEAFDRLYVAEQKMGQILGVFTVLALGIACLGLFGLGAYAAEQRTREIGVRKVLGASVGGIVLLLSKDFTRLVGIAFVVAVPVAYFAMSRWLEDFAYRIEISWWIFLLAGSLALAIALVTVSYQSIKAALADPVDSLRYE